MAEGDIPSSWSADSDSVLSCSVYYSTEFSEDDVLSETGSGASLSALHTEEVLPYLFKPERSSNEPDVDLMEILDAVDTWEERIGNTRLVLMLFAWH